MVKKKALNPLIISKFKAGPSTSDIIREALTKIPLEGKNESKQEVELMASAVLLAELKKFTKSLGLRWTDIHKTANAYLKLQKNQRQENGIVNRE